MLERRARAASCSGCLLCLMPAGMSGQGDGQGDSGSCRSMRKGARVRARSAPCLPFPWLVPFANSRALGCAERRSLGYVRAHQTACARKCPSLLCGCCGAAAAGATQMAHRGRNGLLTRKLAQAGVRLEQRRRTRLRIEQRQRSCCAGTASCNSTWPAALLLLSSCSRVIGQLCERMRCFLGCAVLQPPQIRSESARQLGRTPLKRQRLVYAFSAS